MTKSFDAVVLGMGPGGEVAATKLLEAGRSVAVVERELIGGECAYWACVPSKTLLRPFEVRAEASRAAGVAEPDVDPQEVFAYRDFMAREWDDSNQVKGYEDQGAEVFKTQGRMVGRGRIEVGDEIIEAADVIVATGSDPVIPELEGLTEIDYWTNREATGMSEVPESVIVLGGGPVGIEMAQLLARLGSEVTLVHSRDHLLNREEERPTRLIQDALEEDGVTMRLGVRAAKARRKGRAAELEMNDGSTERANVVLVATGRKPRVDGLGLESTPATVGKRGMRIDQHCRAADGLWGIGDVTGTMQFTHVAKYQGRIASSNIIGRERVASYGSVPRVVFSDPEVAAVGMTEAAARDAGLDVAAHSVRFPDLIGRPWTYERDPKGELGLIVDKDRRVLVGAWVVGPLAGEWIHPAALAIRAGTTVDVLLDTVPQFPTFTEAYLYALEKMEL